MSLLLALAAASAAAAAAPSPAAAAELFHEWVVGCDNGGACTAVALADTASLDRPVTMAVTVPAGGGGEPDVRIRFWDGDGASVRIDGTLFALAAAKDAEGVAVLRPERPREFLQAVRTGRDALLLDAAGQELGRLSTQGATAALLRIDDRQGRIGTVTAFVRPGPKGPEAVPAARPLPTVRAAPLSTAAPRPFSEAEAERVRAQLCEEMGLEPEEWGEIEVSRLDAAHSLALVPSRCWSGAYNIGTLLLVAKDAGPWVPAALDLPPNPDAEGMEKSILFNPWWESGRLETFFKGRGLGDCGTREAFVWDGARFRLVARDDMPECRGATDLVPLFRAEVRR
ncbi:MAG: DUF1176 domain-containing protein [Allosphingosinicella sp.]